MKFCILNLIAIGMILFSNKGLAGFSLKLNDSNASLYQSFLLEVDSLIPEKIKVGINKEIPINFKKIVGRNKDSIIRGQTLFSKVTLDESLKDFILNGKGKKAPDSTNHPDQYTYAVATLLHEISHIYDSKNFMTGRDLQFYRECQEMKNKEPMCEALVFKKRTISDSPLFLNLIDFKRSGFLEKLQSSNKFGNRRPDLYELQSKDEAFAVNFEFFILDKDYKCRRPGLYAHLSEALDFEPYKDFSCGQDWRIPKRTNNDKGEAEFYNLDPSRVFEVHYLFAGKGKGISSRWGHSMIRLVICAPHRKTLSADCLNDRAHHAVLSFRADITNFEVNTIKGLKGDYPSKLFVLSLDDVIKEYAQGELRDLSSIPLKFGEEEKRSLVLEALDRYWNYQGRYYFLSNNCADETLALLQRSLPLHTALGTSAIATPKGLLSRLSELDLANLEVFDNLDQAKVKGYYFESSRNKLEVIYSELVKNFFYDDRLSLEDLLKSTLSEREALLKMVTEATDISNRRALVGRLIFLEDALIKLKIRAFEKKLGKVLADLDKKTEKHDSVLAYYELQKSRDIYFKLGEGAGYGLPQLQDNLFSEFGVNENEKKKMMEQENRISVLVEERFSSEIEEIKIMENYKRVLMAAFLEVGKK